MLPSPQDQAQLTQVCEERPMVDDVDTGEVRSDPEECDVLWEWRWGSHTGPGAEASPNQGSEMGSLGVTSTENLGGPRLRHRESARRGLPQCPFRGLQGGPLPGCSGQRGRAHLRVATQEGRWVRTWDPVCPRKVPTSCSASRK